MFVGCIVDTTLAAWCYYFNTIEYIYTVLLCDGQEPSIESPPYSLPRTDAIREAFKLRPLGAGHAVLLTTNILHSSSFLDLNMQ